MKSSVQTDDKVRDYSTCSPVPVAEYISTGCLATGPVHEIFFLYPDQTNKDVKYQLVRFLCAGCADFVSNIYTNKNHHIDLLVQPSTRKQMIIYPNFDLFI